MSGGNRGAEANRAELTFEGASGSREMSTQSGMTVALLQEGMSLEGGVYTLLFGIIDPSPNVPYECVATVKTSDAGNTIERQFNIVKGTAITLSGRVFDIRVTDTTPAVLPLSDSTPTPGADSTYVVTCIIERGTRAPKSANPTLYGGVAQIALHATLTIPIPENAGVESLEISSQVAVAFPSTNPNVTVEFTTAAGGIFKQYNPILEPGFVTIPPGATEITITNNDGTNAVNTTITWGIDG